MSRQGIAQLQQCSHMLCREVAGGHLGHCRQSQAQGGNPRPGLQHAAVAAAAPAPAPVGAPALAPAALAPAAAPAAAPAPAPALAAALAPAAAPALGAADGCRPAARPARAHPRWRPERWRYCARHPEMRWRTHQTCCASRRQSRGATTPGCPQQSGMPSCRCPSSLSPRARRRTSRPPQQLWMCGG